VLVPFLEAPPPPQAAPSIVNAAELGLPRVAAGPDTGEADQ
jgi:hypothetical protein